MLTTIPARQYMANRNDYQLPIANTKYVGSGVTMILRELGGQWVVDQLRPELMIGDYYLGVVLKRSDQGQPVLLASSGYMGNIEPGIDSVPRDETESIAATYYFETVWVIVPDANHSH